MTTETSQSLVILLLLLVIIFMMTTVGMFPQYTFPYGKGVRDTYKEAFSKGLMTKEIDKDDKVIYKWIESK